MRKIALLCFMLCGLMVFAACANQAPAPAPAPAAPAAPAAPETPAEEGTEMLGTGVPLIIYTNHAPYRAERIAERAAQYGFNVQGVTAGGGATMERLVAERHNPMAHIVYGLNIFLWHNLLENDVIMPYTPSWADRVYPAGISHPDGYYHFAEHVTILLAYNADEIDEPPTDWFDLWMDPRFHGTYQFETHLGGATTRKVISGILTRFMDPDGFLGVSDEGWNHIEMFYRYGVPNIDNTDLFINMADSTSPINMGQMWSSGLEPREEQYGVNAGAVVPAVGVPYSLHFVGVVANNNEMEETLRFLEWFTPEIRAELRVDDPVQRYAQLPMQDIDWDFVSRHIDAWVEHIYLNLMP